MHMSASPNGHEHELFTCICVILNSIKYHISAFAEHMLSVRVTVTRLRNVILYKYIDNLTLLLEITISRIHPNSSSFVKLGLELDKN